jgi:hypothetical protein
MDLTPAQRDKVQQLLEQELHKAWRSLIDRGATPADAADMLDERRRAVQSLLLDVPTDDGQDLIDDSRHPDGVEDQG